MEKRRDSKNRVLYTGESQRKDGRYTYKYTDRAGKPQFVYSWKLVATDRLPKGKRGGLSLREKEAQIQKDLADGIDSRGKKMTLCELYEKQNASRANVKRSTEKGRKALKNILEHDMLGARSIDLIRPTDAKEWAVRMKENGYSYHTINNCKRSLKASFYIAIQNDYVRKNPFDFKLSDVIADDSIRREALTENEEKELLSFVQTDRTYSRHYNAIATLLNTGLRISELCGLTANDLDFENRLITVNHQLLRDTEKGYYIDTPKTRKSVRQIPMNKQAAEALQSQSGQQKDKPQTAIDGYSNFLFLNAKGQPMYGAAYASIFTRIVNKYNKCHDKKLPHITPHMLRHTFCTRLANRNMNPINLQALMGHSNVSLTLNLYAHSSIEGIQAELERLTD